MKEYSEKALRTRERILDAAGRLFHLNGYNATGLDKIIAEAGVTKGNFYYHFETKEALATATVEWHRRETYRELRLEPTFPGETPLAILFRVLEGMVERTLRADRNGEIRGCYFGNLALELSVQSDAVRRAVAAVFDEMRAGFADLLNRARASGEIDATVDPRQSASLILSLMEGAVMMAKTNQTESEARNALVFIRGWLGAGTS